MDFQGNIKSKASKVITYIDECLNTLFQLTIDEGETIIFIHKIIMKYAKTENITKWPCLRQIQKTFQSDMDVDASAENSVQYSCTLSKSDKNHGNLLSNISTSNKEGIATCLERLRNKHEKVIKHSESFTDYAHSDNESTTEDKISLNVSSIKLKHKYKCCICNEKKDNLLTYLKHICHHEGVPLSCRNCKKSFENRSHYGIHKLLRACSLSDIENKGKSHTFEDIQLNDIDTLKSFIICPHCGLSFKKAFNLQSHLKKAISCRSEPKQSQLKCVYKCKLSFCNKDELEKHTKRVHAHLCKICKKEFPTIKHLNSHLSTHKRIYKCEHCSNEFTKRQLLREHKRNSHKVVKKEKVTHTCSYCKTVFVRKFLLQRHIYKEHSEKDPPPVFACDKCPTILKTQSSFNDHLKIHSENHSYVCNICEKGFKLKNLLRRHLLKHTSTQTFECDQCHAKIKRKDHLHRHIRTMHQGVKTTESKAKKPPKTKSEEAPPREEQFFSLIDVQSGEMFSVPATDYTYNLIFKEQNKVNTPLISNTEPIPWSGSTAILHQAEPTPASSQYSYIPAKQDTFMYGSDLNNPENIASMSLVPPTYQQNIIAEPNSNIVVITNVSDLLCIPEVVVSNSIQ